MDTRATALMDDLLKRQNAAGQGDFDPSRSDGGGLNGGDELRPKPGESDVGSGLELDRSLQQVEAQEAWLVNRVSSLSNLGCSPMAGKRFLK